MIYGRRYAAVKRALDVFFVLLLLPLVLPAALLCGLAVRLDSRGRVLFSQRRTGRDGRIFNMYKFRTMVRNADELKPSLQHLSIVPYPDFKLINDPRVTRVGRFLRATSLDELPQLWNVLKGDMSLVGPRPTSFSTDTWQLWHARRLEVRPGVTGLWQIMARNSVDFDERTRLDDVYIRSLSLALDMKILLKTLPVVVKRSGA